MRNFKILSFKLSDRTAQQRIADNDIKVSAKHKLPELFFRCKAHIAFAFEFFILYEPGTADDLRSIRSGSLLDHPADLIGRHLLVNDQHLLSGTGCKLFYFFLCEDGILKKFGKELTRQERNCEYVGICVLRRDWVLRFHDQLCRMIESGEYDLWWENVLYSLADKEKIRVVDVDGIFWSEVDTIADYKRVLAHCL